MHLKKIYAVIIGLNFIYLNPLALSADPSLTSQQTIYKNYNIILEKHPEIGVMAD